MHCWLCGTLLNLRYLPFLIHTTPPTPPNIHRLLQHLPSAEVETLPSGMLEPVASGGEHPAPRHVLRFSPL